MNVSRLRALCVLAGMTPAPGCADLGGNQPTNTSATVGDSPTIGDAGDTGQSVESSSSGTGGTTSGASDTQDPTETGPAPTSGAATNSGTTTAGDASDSASSSTTMPGETAPGSSTGYGTIGYDSTGYYTTGYGDHLPDGAAPDDPDWFSQTLDCRRLDAHCPAASATATAQKG